MDTFLYFLPILVVIFIAYFSGIATVFWWQYLERRSLRIQEELDHETDYTLTVLRQPRDFERGE